MMRISINRWHERWANLHPFVRFLILAVLTAALGLCTVKPAYREFKEWRLHQNLKSARKAVSEKRMDDARDLSLTVLRAGDPGIEAFRILEESTASLRDPRHGDIARALMTHPEGSDEDRLHGFRGIVGETPLGVVGQAWTTLPPGCRTAPRFATAFADRLIGEHRLSEAASVLLAVPAEKRDGALNRCLIRVLIGSGRREGFEEAQRLIAAGFVTSGTEFTEWLDLLEKIPAMSLEGKLLEPIRSMLGSASSRDPARCELMLGRMDYAAQYNRRAEVLAGCVGKWKDAAPEALARFLSDLGLYQRLLETFPPERVNDCPELFPMVLDALEKTAAWDRVPPLLDQSGRLLPKAVELAHRAMAASKASDSTALAEAWKAALAEAKSAAQAGTLLKLQRLAEEAGMQDEADLAMVEAIRLGRGPLPLYADLKPLLTSLAAQGRENTMLEICAIYLSFEPGNPVLLTQYAYLACLNRLAEPATILKALTPLAKAFPKEMPIQCVLAAVYLCDGQNARAAETLAPFELDPGTLPPSYRMTVLATRLLNRRITTNDPLLTGFPWKSLLPSERKKFSELIRSAGT